MIFRLFLSAAFANGIGLGLGFLTHLSLAHLMPVESYGLFTFVFSIAVMISLFAGFGFHASIQRIIPGLQLEGGSKIFSLVRFAQSLSFASAAFAGAIVFTTLYLFYPASLDPVSLYSGGFALALFMSVTRLQVGIFKALKKGTLGICYDTVFREALFLVAIWGAAALGFSLSMAREALWLYGFILCCLFGVSFIQIRNLTRIDTLVEISKDDIKVWLKISIPMMILIGTQMLLHRADIIMLGFIRSFEDVGAYGFAAKIAQASTIIFMAGTTIFSPRAAGFFQSGDLDALRALYKKMQGFMLIGTGLICVILYLAYPVLLQFFDPAYSAGLMAFNILIAGYFLNAALGPSSYLMVMTRHEVTIMWITFFAVFLNIILNLILIPLYGIAGAAIATAVSLNLRNGIGYVIFLTDEKLKDE